MPRIPTEEYRSRVKKAKSLMNGRGIDGLIVTDHVSYYYFTGHKPAPWMASRPFIFILPCEGDPAIITWSGPETFSRCYKVPFPSWVEDWRFYPDLPFSMEEPTDWGIRAVLEEKALQKTTIGIELGLDTGLGIPVNDFLHLRTQLPDANFVDSGPVVWGCRMIKSDWEIAASKKACDIGGRAWMRCLDELRIGISVEQVKRKIQQYYLEEGADLDSAEVMALGATGPNGTFQKGDILYLDVGPAYLGYRMDYARRAVFGKPSRRQEDEHNLMWDILFKVMDEMRPGVQVRDIFEYSQSLVNKTGLRNYSDHPAKRIGHGIGLESEPPSINAFDTRVLQKGMILTPEPKIETVEGLLNPEEQIVITDAGFEQISTIPEWKLFVVN